MRKHYPDDDQYLDEVVSYLNASAPIRRCGEVSRDGNRICTVITHGTCDCPVLHAPISATWCQCSKGSLLSVYRQVFPEKVYQMDIISTVAAGGQGCRFVTTYR